MLLVSSMHHQCAVDTDTKKPEIILFYNETKSGVDALDEKCSLYSTSRRTRRWPMALFHAILNIAGINSRVIYMVANQNEQLTRLDFLKTLGKSLSRPCMERRIRNLQVPRKLRMKISQIPGVQIPQQVAKSSDVPKSKRKRCSICPTSMDRKTNHACCACKFPVCQQCAQLICPNCQ